MSKWTFFRVSTSQTYSLTSVITDKVGSHCRVSLQDVMHELPQTGFSQWLFPAVINWFHLWKHSVQTRHKLVKANSAVWTRYKLVNKITAVWTHHKHVDEKNTPRSETVNLVTNMLTKTAQCEPVLNISTKTPKCEPVISSFIKCMVK